MGLNFGFGCFNFFCFFFLAKLAATNNHRRRLSDISYYSTFSRDSNDIKNFQKNYTESVEKNRFEVFYSWSNFELISKVLSNCNSLFKLNVSRENLALLKKRCFLEFFSAISGVKNLRILFFFLVIFSKTVFQLFYFTMTLKYA